MLLPQTPETLLTHLAAYRLGAVVVPLFTLFGDDGLRFRLADSGAKALVTDGANLGKVLAIRDDLPDLDAVFSIDLREGGAHGFWQELGKAADACRTEPTAPDDPAFLCYTSGTTGPPKGALHAHRVLIGHLPGLALAYEHLGQPGDCLWTPADWAWMGGLTNVLLPGLAAGVPVIAHRMAKFDPERAVALVRDLGVRNAFLPPTALKLMRQAGVAACPGLRSVASAGEPLGAEMLGWGRGVFGLEINEFYGQTECNVVVGNCAAIAPVRPGSAGRAIPGHDVAILDADGGICAPGQPGEIAVRAPDPVMFLGYWRRPDRTAEKVVGRLAAHRRRGGDGRGRLRVLLQPDRRRHHLVGLPHRPVRNRGVPRPGIPTSRWRRWSACPTRSAPRRSRPSSCCAPAPRRRASPMR